MEGGAADRAELVRLDDLVDFDPCRPVAHTHRRDAETVCLFGCGSKTLDICWVDRDRLFYEDMLVCVEGGDREIDMGVRMGADGDEVDVGMVDDRIRVVVELDTRGVDDLLVGVDVTRVLGLAEVFEICICNGGDGARVAVA